ncbi:MAG TPA: methyl-accepting chemotaxis protein [Isosphaeraceae bacterium]|nr:methyl-accepting chemotaxis protein [Isosphaeraceae bacterium]
MMGSIAGGAGGSGLAMALSFGMDSKVAIPLGLLSGVIAGAAGIWLAVRGLARQLGAQVEALEAAARDPMRSAHPDFGWAVVDKPLASLREEIERGRRAQEQLDEVEHLARSLWRAAEGSVNGTNGTADAHGNILGLLGEVRQTGDQVVDHARALDQATEQISSGALDQSQTVARTTTTVESLSNNIDQISHNAEAATEAGQRARQEARRGLEQVHGLIEGIDKLRAHIESNGRKVRRLGDRSVEIGTIVDLIDGISGRTDMLALNATIESVRAGEHGRGFAVVAEEIRKLAERTAAATREIGTLVEAIQADTNESIAALGQEQAEVEQEAQRVREAGAALERISEVAEHSARLVEGISRSATDQVQSTHELVRAMQRISEVTQQTLGGTSRAREHVRLLSQRCERLHRLSAVPGSRLGAGPVPSNGNGTHPRRGTVVEQST